MTDYAVSSQFPVQNNLKATYKTVMSGALIFHQKTRWV